MSLILNIDTAVQTASVCLADAEQIISLKTNPSQKDHAAWLHVVISQMMEEQGLKLKDLHAIAISEGPGSYTGLRVGMAAAKGICYALDIPLIMVSTLKMMANSASPDKSDLLCPMIDARRMEVFTALYDKSLNEVQTPVNMILSEDSFKEKLDAQSISFFGNGSQKFKGLISHPNANFQETEPIAAHMVILSYNKFKNSEFADLAYSEPFYGKDFHSSAVI